MNLYKNKIKFFILNKYRDADYHDKKFLQDFKNFRQDFKKELIKKKSINKKFKKDQTFFDLKKSFYIDERMDFVKSTKAACKYLKYLYTFIFSASISKNLKFFQNSSLCPMDLVMV